MPYILINPSQNLFVQLNKNNGIKKVSRKDKATIFPTFNKANYILQNAPSKLKNWTPLEIKNDETIGANIRRPISYNTKHNIYMNQKGLCSYCGDYYIESEMTIDHIVPLSKGGTNDESNLQCTCNNCNQLKGNKFHDDFLNQITKIIQYQDKQKIKHSQKNDSIFSLPLFLPDIHFIANPAQNNYKSFTDSNLYLFVDNLLIMITFLIFFFGKYWMSLLSLMIWIIYISIIHKFDKMNQLKSISSSQEHKLMNHICDGTLISKDNEIYIELIPSKELILVKNISTNNLVDQAMFDLSLQTLTINRR